jgi:hypothetical protein
METTGYLLDTNHAGTPVETLTQAGHGTSQSLIRRPGTFT